jgi:outer membrane receptor protein involved in Fe transport
MTIKDNNAYGAARPRSSVSLAVKLAVLTCGLPMLATGQLALAQAQSGETELEEVVVTGSRIPRDTFTTAAPLTVLDSVEIAAVGTTNIGEYLQNIPQTIAAINNSNSVFSNNSSALQTTALRNLGAERTLVLVNGKRFVSGQSPGDGYGVDLNAIPVPLIERVEIKTGGTSAIYGSDAIAGVVNFILKDDFEGVEVNLQTNQPQDGDRTRGEANITMGSNFDKGNAWVSVGYSSDSGLTAQDRDFSNTDLAYYGVEALEILGISGAPGDYWLGSSFPPGARMGSYNGDGTPFRSGLADRENSDRFNRALYRDLASPVDRTYGAAGIHYDITENVKAHTLITYNQTEIDTTFEPFPLDLVGDIWDIPKGGTGGLDVATSPLLPELLRTNLLADGITNLNQLAANTTSRRLVEFEGRGSNIDRRTFRMETGIEVEFSNGMWGELYGVWGQTKADQQVNSGINAERAVLALDAEVDPNDPTGQTLRCVSEEARRFGCSPFNVFGEGTISPEAVAYLALNTQTDQLVEQTVVGATLTGDIGGFELPGGAMAFAVGAEYREETGSEIPDAAVQAGVTTSNKILPTGGSYDVSEIFGELRVPIIKQLELSAAARWGDYSTVGEQTNFSLGIDAPITEWIRLRGTYSDAVRAPNVSDLFSGAGETFASVQDACDGVTNATAGNVGTNCRSVPAIQDRIDATGAFTLTQVERQSTGGFNSGNPLAGEETADTYTAGFVLTPRGGFLENFQLAVDYYSIELEGVLALPLRSDVVTNCYAVDPGVFDPTCPGPVQNGVQTLRDPATGVLIEVNRSLNNQENWNTSGIDVEIDYFAEIGPGGLGVNLLWNMISEFDVIDNVTGTVNDEAGEILYPDNRAYLSVNYTMDRWGFYWTTAWIDAAVDSNTPELTNENSDTFGFPLVGPNAGGNECSAYGLHSVSASFNATDSLLFSLGIRNVLDEDPCALTQISKYGNTGTNTAAELYDVTGRDFYLTVRARF